MDRVLSEFARQYGENRRSQPGSGLASDASPLLRRIVALTDASDVMAGTGKAVVMPLPKPVALEQPYITLSSRFLGVFRIDIDRAFASIGHLLDELRQAVLPCDPHLVVARRSDDRRVESPHVLWMLPADGQVWAELDDPRCRARPVRLWHAILRGITDRLTEVGADIGGVQNALRIKNPLSPHWTNFVTNEVVFPSLEDWLGWVEPIWAMDGIDLDASSSNLGFTRLRAEAFQLARTLYVERTDDALFEANRSQLETAILQHLEKVLVDADGTKVKRRTLESIAAFTATNFDTSRAGGKRGVLREQLVGRSRCEKQAAGGRHAAARKHQGSRDKLVKCLLSLAPGTVVRKKLLSDGSGVSRPTVDAHWQDLIDLVRSEGLPVRMQTYGAAPTPAVRIVTYDEILATLKADGSFTSRVWMPAEAFPDASACDDVCGSEECGCLLREAVLKFHGFDATGFDCGSIKRKLEGGARQVEVTLFDYERDGGCD